MCRSGSYRPTGWPTPTPASPAHRLYDPSGTRVTPWGCMPKKPIIAPVPSSPRPPHHPLGFCVPCPVNKPPMTTRAAHACQSSCRGLQNSLGCPCGATGYKSRSIRRGAGARSRSHVGSGQHSSATDDHVLAAMPPNVTRRGPGWRCPRRQSDRARTLTRVDVHVWYRLAVLTEAGSGADNHHPTAQEVCKVRADAGNPDVLGDQDTTVRRVP